MRKCLKQNNNEHYQDSTPNFKISTPSIETCAVRLSCGEDRLTAAHAWARAGKETSAWASTGGIQERASGYGGREGAARTGAQRTQPEAGEEKGAGVAGPWGSHGCMELCTRLS